jgi:hypothetical protein
MQGSPGGLTPICLRPFDETYKRDREVDQEQKRRENQSLSRVQPSLNRIDDDPVQPVLKLATLFAKRLERGRFVWPSVTDGVVTISSAQLGYLLEGIDWRMPQRTWRPQSAG